MKKSTKAIIFSIAFCFLCAIGVFCVFAVKNFSLNGSGSIKFIAPGVAATISDATLDGLSMESGSGTMSSFSVTSTMTAAQVESLDGYKSWSGLKLLFDDEADGRATISFTVTNNSTKSNENVMVKLSSSTTTTDAIHVTPCADYCIGSGKSHTFSVSMAVANGDVSATLNSYVLTVELQLLKTEQIPTISEENTNGFTFSLDSTNKTATLTKYTKPASVSATNLSVVIPSLVRDGSTIYHVTEILGSDWSDNPFYSVKDNMVSVTLPTTLTKVGSFAFVYCSAVRGDLIIPHGVLYAMCQNSKAEYCQITATM